MKNYFTHPKKYSTKKGISTDFMFLYGRNDWIKSLISNLSSKIKFLVANHQDCLNSWHVQAIQDAEIAVFNTDGMKDFEKALFLMPIARLAQFQTKVFYHGELNDNVRTFIKLGDVEILKNPQILEEIVGNFFIFD